jgi:tRNA threonylcarbamoyl adenosine modification protein YeaZ
VAVARGEDVLALVAAEALGGHSSSILTDIDAALSQAALSLQEIDLFAVAAGPGSFTGLRSGVATVKAFAATLGRPAVGVRTLHAMAVASGVVGRIVACLPAGRGEFFAQTLSVGAEKRVDELEGAVHVAPEKLLEKALGIDGDLCWAGSGVPFIEDIIWAAANREGITLRVATGDAKKAGGREWTLAPVVGGLAAQVSALALISYQQGGAVSANALKAFYVRASDAEIKGQCPAPKSPAKV